MEYFILQILKTMTGLEYFLYSDYKMQNYIILVGFRILSENI
jgi:hypothetical protein